MQAFVDFFCLNRKFLLYNLLIRNLKVKYRGSALGYFWTLLVPLVQVLIFYFLYQIVLKIKIPNFLPYIVTGLLPWYFFSSTLNESMETLTAGKDLLTQVPVPIQSFPMASVFANVINFVVTIPIMYGVLFWTDVEIGWGYLSFFALSGLLFFFTYALAFIFACLYVVLKDLKHIMSLALQVWLYASPVFYPLDFVPERYQWVMQLNPMTGFFICTREILVDNKVWSWYWLGHFTICTLVALGLAMWVSRRYGKRLVELV